MLKKINLKALPKKGIAIITAFVILISALVVGFGTFADTIKVWDGTKAESFAGGTGSKTDPFIIENGEQLYKMLMEYSNKTASSGKYFKITKDIYLNNVTDGSSVKDLAEKNNWLKEYGTTALPNGSTTNAFAGNLDGDGHTIYGLYTTGAGRSGLFHTIVNGSSIKNLSFENVYLKDGRGYGGALAGRAHWVSGGAAIEISNCSVVNAEIGGDMELAGGLVGNTSDASINFTYCYSYGLTLSNWDSAGTPGGLIGNCWSGGALKMVSCYTAGYFPMNSKVNKVTCSNVYTNVAVPSGNTTANITVLADEAMKGDAAKTNMAGLDFDNVFDTVAGGYPVFKSKFSAIKNWDGTKDYNLSGSGIESDPYLIETPEQLAAIVTGNNGGTFTGKHFKLANDIVIHDTSKVNWKETAKNWVWADFRFVGTFDGAGHTIEGLYFSGSQKRFGLFSFIGDTVIKNVKFKGAYIYNTVSSDAEGCAIVAGQASAKADFENVYIDATCEINAPNTKGVAGIIGRSNQNINIKNCAVLGTYAGKSHVGAFFGTHWGGTQTIANSFTASNAPVVASRTPTVTNTYATVKTADNYYDKNVVLLTPDQMKGDAAKTNMAGLDFDTIFQTVANDYPIINVREKEELPPEPLWSGAKDSNLEGAGTEENPFLIKTPEQLAAIATGNNGGTWTGKYFKLANDIRIHDTTKSKWRETARNWVWADFRFVGTLDGDGHTIEGLYYSGNQKRMGLFSYIGDTLIKNVKFTGAYIENTTSEEGQAIVAAQASAKADFEAIYIDETCVIKAPNVKGVAGIIGRSNQNVNIRNCAVLGSYTGKSHVGAFFGTFWGGAQTITNCYTASNAPVTASRTPTVVNTYATVKTADNYYDKNVFLLTTDQMKGDAAKTNMAGLDFEEVFKAVDGKFPVIELRKVAPPPVLPDYVWDGTKADSFAGGDGSEKSPFLIATPEQLYKMVAEYSTYEASYGVYFKITEDLYLNDVKDGTLLTALTYKNNWLKNYGTEVPAASKANAFNGILDGDNHTIYGLYIDGANSAGLFPAISSYTVVKNLAFNNVLITGGGAGGALAGQAIYRAWQSGATVTNCSVVNATIGVDADKEFAGGLIGNINDCTVTFANCYAYGLSLSNWESKGTPGGIVGSAWNSGTLKIVTSYSAGYFPVNSKISKAQCTNVYTNVAIPAGNTTTGITVLTDAQMKGDAAKTNLAGFDFIRSWQTVENGYPIHFVYVKPSYVWDGSTADNFAGGKGTADDPFLISNGAQLYKMVTEYSNASGEKGSINKQYYFKLTNDIYLNDVTAEDLATASVDSWNTKFNSWYKVTSYSKGFCGDLDGAGYTVYGLYSNTGYSALIPVLLDGGKVHHINIKNAYVYGTESAGGIVGFVKSHYTLAPVEVSYNTVDNVVISSNKKYVGGIVGGFADIPITITDSSVTRAKLSSTNENPHLVAGFIGTGWGNVTHTITNCFTDSSVNPVTATTDKEQFDIIANKAIFTNVYTSAKQNFVVAGITKVSESALKGKAAKNTLIGFNFTEDWTLVEGDFPIVKKTAGLWKFDTTKAGEVWSGKLAANYASGEGTKENPYIIKTGGQLALLANDALNGKTAGRYYKITADIILNDTSKAGWEAKANEWFVGSWAQAFKGYLDGGYHTISGLYLNKTKETYTGTKYYGGLFAAIGAGAVIEKLGIVNSSLTFTHDLNTKYLGAFAGFVDQYKVDEVTPDMYPVIRECFADTTVYLNGGSCGGFIGCATRPIRVEDSFFTGKVAETGRGLFGYSKLGTPYDQVLVKNFYAADSAYAVLSNTAYDTFLYENCFSSSAQDTEGVTRLFVDRMCGNLAKEYMATLDFEKVWRVGGEKETPGLRGFAETAYNNVMNPEDITVSFETNCDILVDSVKGKAYSKLELPTLEREGYIFEGWYSYPELDAPYNYDYFPSFNTILYAKWTLDGYYQDFETYDNSIYDYHEGIDYYRPTSAGYTALYVRSGAKSIHRLGGISDYLDFLIFYKEELEVGKTYKMVFYTTTDQDAASVKLSLVHLDWPDVYDNSVAVDEIGTLESIVNGEWVEHTFTFTAKAKWIALRTEGEDSVFFDDFTLFNSADEVDAPNKDKENDKEAKSDKKDSGLSTVLLVVIIAAGAVVLLGGAAVATVVIVKKRKK